MFTIQLSVIILVQVIVIKSENCVTPDNEEGNCVSLYTCPKLISLLTKKQKDGEEYVRRSRCGVTHTEPLVCCPLGTKEACTTPNQKDGKCTLLTSCPELLGLLESQKAESIEHLRKSSCGFSNSDVLVCCPAESPNLQNVGLTQAKVDLLIPSRRYCGYQHSDDYGSKVQGADITDFPWLAGLQYKFKNGQEQVKCQGALINARYILTAAHCVIPRSEVSLKTVRLGEYNIRNSTDCVEVSGFTECSDPVQEYGAEEIITHPQFELKPLPQFDIALIRLNKTIDNYSDYIRPICLPLRGTESPQTGDSIITSGWSTSSTGSNAEVKKKVLNKLISNIECHRIYTESRRVPFDILDNQMCTEELSNSAEFACAGDSGGPVMFSYKAQWYIEGINSFGSRICGDKYPVVHTRVSKFIDWIRASMKPW